MSMVTKQISDQAMADNLTRIIEEFKEDLSVLRESHPNPAQELDDFVLSVFDPEVLLPFEGDGSEKVLDDEEWNGR